MAKNFIKTAIKHPGSLTATAKKQGVSLSALCAEGNKSAKTSKRCSLMETIERLRSK